MSLKNNGIEWVHWPFFGDKLNINLIIHSVWTTTRPFLLEVKKKKEKKEKSVLPILCSYVIIKFGEYFDKYEK